MTSYQKNKTKIKELEHDIKLMVLYPETEEGIDTFIKYSAKYNGQEEKSKSKR